MEKIEHREVPVTTNPDGAPTLGAHDGLVDRLEAHHEYALLTAAAAIKRRTGSLEEAASLLEWAGFGPPLCAAGLRSWVEENQGRIEGLVGSVAARTIAHGGTTDDG